MQTTGPPRELGTEARLLKIPFQHALESNGTFRDLKSLKVASDPGTAT